MEREIGELYDTNTLLYEKMAKFYTWKYAMNDFLEFSHSDSKILNQNIENIKSNNGNESTE